MEDETKTEEVVSNTCPGNPDAIAPVEAEVETITPEVAAAEPEAPVEEAPVEEEVK